MVLGSAFFSWRSCLAGHGMAKEAHGRSGKALLRSLRSWKNTKFQQAGSLCVESLEDKPFISAAASDRFVCLDPWGPFKTSADYYSAWAEQYLMLIADCQLYPQFPVEAYLVYQFLKDNAAQLSDEEDVFFLETTREITKESSQLFITRIASQLFTFFFFFFRPKRSSAQDLSH